MRRLRILPTLAALAAALLLAAGCGGTTGPPPPTPGAEAPGRLAGVTQLEGARHRVTVTGDWTESAESVQDRLLHRSAELARLRGVPAFRLLRREVEPMTREVRTYVGGPARPLGYAFLPAPFQRPGFGDRREIHVREVRRYRATAEVELLDVLPERPQAEVYDARALLARPSDRD